MSFILWCTFNVNWITPINCAISIKILKYWIEKKGGYILKIICHTQWWHHKMIKQIQNHWKGCSIFSILSRKTRSLFFTCIYFCFFLIRTLLCIIIRMFRKKNIISLEMSLYGSLTESRTCVTFEVQAQQLNKFCCPTRLGHIRPFIDSLHIII